MDFLPSRNIARRSNPYVISQEITSRPVKKEALPMVHHAEWQSTNNASEVARRGACPPRSLVEIRWPWFVAGGDGKKARGPRSEAIQPFLDDCCRSFVQVRQFILSQQLTFSKQYAHLYRAPHRRLRPRRKTLSIFHL